MGLTHWESIGPEDESVGERETSFFAPSQFVEAATARGLDTILGGIGSTLGEFIPRMVQSIPVQRSVGREAIERVYFETLEGRSDPGRGEIVSF